MRKHRALVISSCAFYSYGARVKINFGAEPFAYKLWEPPRPGQIMPTPSPAATSPPKAESKRGFLASLFSRGTSSSSPANSPARSAGRSLETKESIQEAKESAGNQVERFAEDEQPALPPLPTMPAMMVARNTRRARALDIIHSGVLPDCTLEQVRT